MAVRVWLSRSRPPRLISRTERKSRGLPILTGWLAVARKVRERRTGFGRNRKCGSSTRQWRNSLHFQYPGSRADTLTRKSVPALIPLIRSELSAWTKSTAKFSSSEMKKLADLRLEEPQVTILLAEG
jgi:hypothetical protein